MVTNPAHSGLSLLFALSLCSVLPGGEGLSPPRRHVEEIRSSRAEYEIVMGGIADFANASTRRYSGWDIPFGTDISLSGVGGSKTSIPVDPPPGGSMPSRSQKSC